MATFNLSVLERLKLLGILPQVGDLTSLRIVRRIREALSFSEKEHEEFGIVEGGGRCTWTNGSDKPIEFGARACDLVRAALKERNDNQTLEPDLVTLVEKFCPDLCPPEDEGSMVNKVAEETFNGRITEIAH